MRTVLNHPLVAHRVTLMRDRATPATASSARSDAYADAATWGDLGRRAVVRAL